MNNIYLIGTTMQITSMNPAQMAVLESFASVNSSEELAALMKVLKKFYADRLKREMERLWDNGTLDQKQLDQLRDEHLRTPYRQ